MYLHCVDFRGANLTGSDLSRSNIDGADMSGATIQDTALGSSNMQGVNLTSAKFEPFDLMAAEFLNDISGLKQLNVDPTDLSEIRKLIKHFEDAGYSASAAEVNFAMEHAVTQGKAERW